MTPNRVLVTLYGYRAAIAFILSAPTSFGGDFVTDCEMEWKKFAWLDFEDGGRNPIWTS